MTSEKRKEMETRWLDSMGEYLRSSFTRVGNRYEVSDLKRHPIIVETARDFTVSENGRTYRVTVERVS